MPRVSWLRRATSLLVTIIVLGLIVSFIQSPLETVKRVGAPLQIVPSMLGVVPQIKPEDVRFIDLRSQPTFVNITAPGYYAIYSDDQQVLLRTNMLEGANGRTWVTIRSVERGDDVPGTYVARGARPYDPLAAPGRPLILFMIRTPGQYEIRYAPQSGQVSFAPDYTAGRETLILLSWLAQIAILALVIFVALLPRIRRLRQAERQLAATLARKRVATEHYWQDKMKDAPPHD